MATDQVHWEVQVLVSKLKRFLEGRKRRRGKGKGERGQLNEPLLGTCDPFGFRGPRDQDGQAGGETREILIGYFNGGLGRLRVTSKTVL